jgi:hypothetical protein
VWRFFFCKPEGLGLGWAHCDSEICYTNSLIPILSSLKNLIKCQKRSIAGGTEAILLHTGKAGEVAQRSEQLNRLPPVLLNNLMPTFKAFS